MRYGWRGYPVTLTGVSVSHALMVIIGLGVYIRKVSPRNPPPLARKPPLGFRIHFIFDSPDWDSGTLLGAAAFGGQIVILKGKSSVWSAPQARKIRFWNPLNRDF